MKLRRLIILASVAFASACSEPSPQVVGTPFVGPAVFPTIKDLSAQRIVLKRTMRFGVCPNYEVEIRGDGSVNYCGGACVIEFGRRTRVIPKEAVVALVDEFRSANYFALRDSYAGVMTDLPTYLTAIAFDGHSKQVIDYYGEADGMPAAIAELEGFIDKMAGTAEWIGNVGPEAFNDDVHSPDCMKISHGIDVGPAPPTDKPQ